MNKITLILLFALCTTHHHYTKSELLHTIMFAAACGVATGIGLGLSLGIVGGIYLKSLSQTDLEKLPLPEHLKKTIITRKIEQEKSKSSQK